MKPPVRLRAEIVALPAYQQGRAAAPDAHKLSSNENPFPPHPAVREALSVGVNRYPDATGLALRERLAERFGVSADSVLLGAGSVALLYSLVGAAATVGDEVVFPWRSFEAYPGLVTVSGATAVRVPNNPDHEHDMRALAAAVTERTRVVIVCSPNNPTGTTVTRAQVEALLESVPDDVLVLLDEAYREFVTDAEAVDGRDLVRDHPNLVVLRTFSKAYGLAGARIGYAVGHPAILQAVRSTLVPLSVTDAGQSAALAALEHEDAMRDQVAALVAERERLRAGLVAQGWDVPPSSGNFVWLATGERTTAVNEALLDGGVVARPFAPEGIRISVGTPESVDAVLRILAEVVEALSTTG